MFSPDRPSATEADASLDASHPAVRQLSWARPPWTMAIRPSAGSGAGMRRYRQLRGAVLCLRVSRPPISQIAKGAEGVFHHECSGHQLLPLAVLGRFPSWRHLVVFLHGGTWSFSLMRHLVVFLDATLGRFPSWRHLAVLHHGDTWPFSLMAGLARFP